MICFAVSVMKMAELGFDDDILPPGPCSAVRNLEWISAGFGDGFFMRDALSRSSRKYGSWSMPMGMRHWILAMSLVRSLSGSSVQSSGYEVANAATHCTDGKKILPMLVLSLKPKAPRT